MNAYAFTTVDNAGEHSSSSQDPDIEEDHRDEGPYGIQNAGGGIGLDDVAGLQSTSGHLAGLGFGLPLSKLHCEVCFRTVKKIESGNAVRVRLC